MINPACASIVAGESKLVYKLITSHKSKHYVTGTDEEGRTPLHLTCKSDNRLPLTCELIRRKANINALDNVGRTPIFYAIENEAIRTIIALLNQGVDCKIIDSVGKTPLSIAIDNCDELVIELIRLRSNQIKSNR